MKQRTRPTHSGDDLLGLNMNGGKQSDDETNSEIQLHKIRPQEHFIEAQVQEGDTLQAIALRFYCSISELKRINHIHKDNEIFARRTLKVPITPYSVLTELIPTQTQEPTSSAANQLLSINDSADQSHSNGVIKKEDDFAIDCNTLVLNSTIAPSVTPYTDIEPAEQASEDTQLLPNQKRDKISVEAVVVKELTRGGDFGLKWYHLLCCTLFLGVVVPLVYVLFYLPKHEHPFIPPAEIPST